MILLIFSPLIYVVNSDKKEEIANTRVEGDFLVVEGISENFTIRLGKKYKCIKNNRFKLKRQNIQEMGLNKIIINEQKQRQNKNQTPIKNQEK